MSRVFKLYIRTENAAFNLGPDDAEYVPQPELARLLDLVAYHVRNCIDPDDLRHYRTIFDINGNDVGRYALKLEED